MIRRLLCLGAILLLIVVSVPACNSNNAKNTRPTVPDPEGAGKPKPAGG